MSDEIYKTCSSCLEIKELSEFYRDRRSSTGFKNSCKSCDNERLIQWRKNNPEKAKQIAERNASNNREKINARGRKYRKENAEVINKKAKERQAKSRKENPQRHRDYSSNYNKKHPEIQKARTKRKVNNITDSYISSIICKRSNLKRSEIPQSYIELRRANLILRREIKRLSK